MKTCFVIMPIRQPGTPEYEHFRTIRDTVIEPALVGLAYNVVRADDISRSGAVTADIVELIGNAELVVADLTDLNPNVFYELGARHALRKNGTIMLVDETRSDIPFDLQQYRTIKYQPTLAGAEFVRRRLADYANSVSPDGAADNPIHTFIPTLPHDVVAQASGTEEGHLRAQLEEARIKVQRYETEFGALDSSATSISSVVEKLSQDARGALLPTDLINSARVAFERRDVRAFLEVAKGLVQSGMRHLTTLQFAEMATWAGNLGLDDLRTALFEEGTNAHPDDEAFEKVMLQTMAHSTDAAARRMARERYQAMLGVVETEAGEWRLPDYLKQADRFTIAVMLDAFHRDNLHLAALEIAKQMAVQYPTCDVSLRNYARALENVGRHDDSFVVYRAALARSAPGSATNASWLGNSYARDGRAVDAAELYAAAAVLDPDDGEHFLDLALAIKDAIQDGAAPDLPFLAPSVEEAKRRLPADLSMDTVDQLGLCAFSCPQLDMADVQQAAQLYDPVTVSALTIRRQEQENQISRDERAALARMCYDALSSETTTSTDEAVAAVEKLLLGT